MKHNLGIMNATFQQNIGNLFKSKKGGQILKEYASLIRSDKNLLKEYLVYDYLSNKDNTGDLKMYIAECISTLDNVNRTELTESHNKMGEFFTKHKINIDENITDHELYENIHKLIYTKRTIKTVNERVDGLNKIVDYITENKKPNEKPDTSEINEMVVRIAINKFNKKFGDALNEEDKKLIRTISKIKTEIEKAKLIEEYKQECLLLINSMLKEAIDNDTKDKLLDAKEILLEQKYKGETYVSDLMSLIGLKEKLSD